MNVAGPGEMVQDVYCQSSRTRVPFDELRSF
jgi:hypothetical protein